MTAGDPVKLDVRDAGVADGGGDEGLDAAWADVDVVRDSRGRAECRLPVVVELLLEMVST